MKQVVAQSTTKVENHGQAGEITFSPRNIKIYWLHDHDVFKMNI